MKTLDNKNIQFPQKHPLDFNRMRVNNYHLNTTVQCIQPYFDKLEEHLVGYIEKSSYVIGCVAWLTNKNIIEALENIKGIKIIVNKEEFLNSEMDLSQRFFYKCLRGKYDGMNDMFDMQCECCCRNIKNCINFSKLFGDIVKTNNDDKNGAILTCGIVNNFSKMHHKFLIFFNDKIEPTGLWTGSYNLSNNSNYSLENALYITQQNIIIEYIKEFLAIYPFSEPYNWKSGILCKAIN